MRQVICLLSLYLRGMEAVHALAVSLSNRCGPTMNLCGYILWVASSSVELLSAPASKPLPLPDSRIGSLYSLLQPTAVTGPIVVASFLHTLRMIKRRFHGVRPCLVMHHDFPVTLNETISEFGRCARLV
jgi:hypothetical protein